MNKTTTILAAAALALSCLAGCGQAAAPAETAEPAVPAAALETPAPQPSETPEPEETEEAAATMPPAPDFALAAQKYPLDATVLTIDGRGIDWGTFFSAFRERAEFFYVYYGITDYSIPMDEDGETVGDWISEQAEIDLRSLSLFESWAEELGITLTEEDQAAIDGEFQDYADAYYGGDQAAMFADLGVSEAYARRKGVFSRLNDKLFAHYFGEKGALLSDRDALDYLRDHDYLYAKRILLKTLTDEGDPLSEEEIAAKRATAEELLSRLRACDSAGLPELFDELMLEYSEDPNLSLFPDGFYFEKGEIEAMSETVEAMEVGELSDIVDSAYGYQIIYRPPMDPDHVFDNDGSNPYTVRYWAATGLFGAMADERYEAQTVEWAEEFADLDVGDLFAGAQNEPSDVRGD